ncbi:MAG: phospholipase [Rhodospirillaceae bacterium]|nr:phospholipase [Rhodospirillaceae bacterium]|tara:strand:+ start:1147 stop:1815 length:669 start_codon:yes stop_codon:yes gene_type:complete
MNEELPKLSGPIFGPRSTNHAKSIVLLLHGYGSNGDDLIGLAPVFSEQLSETIFLSPNAPFKCEANPSGGFQWFDVWETDHDKRIYALRFAEEIINNFIDFQLEKLGLDDSKLVFLGFSQGTMLSMQTALRRKKKCAGILGYSGRLEFPDRLPDEIQSRPLVTLIHGEDDPLLAIDLMNEAETVLLKNGVSVNSFRRPGLGHGIDMEGIKIGMEFLSKRLNN